MKTIKLTRIDVDKYLMCRLYSCLENNCLCYDCCVWGNPLNVYSTLNESALTYKEWAPTLKTTVTTDNLKNPWNIERIEYINCSEYKEEKKMEEKSFTFKEFVSKLDLNNSEHLSAMGIWISYFYAGVERITNEKISLERIYKGLDSYASKTPSCWKSWVEKNLGPREIKYSPVILGEMDKVVYINMNGGANSMQIVDPDYKGRAYLLKMVEVFNKYVQDERNRG